MFLITTADERTWKNDEDIIFLGEWCKLYSRKHVWSELNYKVMDYPWDRPGAIKEGHDVCERILESLIVKLTDYFNEIHEVKFSKRYWRIIIGPWLVYYISALYDRYICLRIAFEKYPDLNTLCLSEKSYITPIDYSNFKLLSTSDLYNLQLYSQLIELMGYTMPERGFVIPNEVKTQMNISTGSIKKGFGHFKFFINALADKLGSVFMDQMYIPLQDVLKITLMSKLRVWPILTDNSLSILPNEINKKARKKLLDLSDNDSCDFFESLLIKTLPQNFPSVYIESYNIVRDYISKTYKNKPKAIISSTGWFFDESLKVLAAESVEKGAKLLVTQHGGYFGTEANDLGKYHELSICNNFFSWGWGNNDDIKIKPLPQPKLTKYRKMGLKNKSISPTGLILHTSTSFPRYLELFRNVPVGPQTLTYYEDQFEFIRSLPLVIQRMMVIRPYPHHEYGWEQHQRFKDEFPNIKIDDGSKNIQKMFEMCRLVICSDNQTLFLEAMSYNIPTLLFIDIKHWKIQDEAVFYFQELERVGIFLNDSKTAAEKVVQVFNDPSAWWYSVEVQSVREKFINKFALASDNWLNEWMDVLNMEKSTTKI